MGLFDILRGKPRNSVGPDGRILDSTGPIDAARLRTRIEELWR